MVRKGQRQAWMKKHRREKKMFKICQRFSANGSGLNMPINLEGKPLWLAKCGKDQALALLLF